MSQGAGQPLALIVRQAPYAQRSPRAQLDVALAAASLGLPLEIYFLGDAIWQLVTGSDPQPALLPRGLKGWAAIPDMTQARFFAEQESCTRMANAGAECAVTLEAHDIASMSRRWRACRQVMAL